MRPFFGRIRKFKKSGAYCYLSARLIDDETFPFKDDTVVKIEADNENKKLTVTLPEWWELLDWNKLHDAFEKLPDDLKKRIREAGLVDQN